MPGVDGHVQVHVGAFIDVVITFVQPPREEMFLFPLLRGEHRGSVPEVWESGPAWACGDPCAVLTATPATRYSSPHGRCPHWRLPAFQGLEPALHFPCRFVLNTIRGWAHVAWGLSQPHGFPTPGSSAYEPRRPSLPQNSYCLHGPSRLAQLPRQSPRALRPRDRGCGCSPGEL